MSIASSHFQAINDHAAALLGDTVGAMRPHDVDFVEIAGVIVGKERTERRDSNEGGIDIVRVRDIVAQSSLIPGEIPRSDLIWQISGDRYAVDEFTRVDGGYVSFKLRRVEASEVTRKGYRGGR